MPFGMGSGPRRSAVPPAYTSSALSIKRTPAKHMMEAVSVASIANSRYPILINGNADPHSTLHTTAMPTAAAGLPKKASKREGEEDFVIIFGGSGS